MHWEDVKETFFGPRSRPIGLPDLLAISNYLTSDSGDALAESRLRPQRGIWEDLFARLLPPQS